MVKRLLLGMVLVLAMNGAVLSDPNQAAVVTRVDPGSVGVNFGSQQRAQYGQQFYIYRNGLLVGQVRLSQVADNSATAQVIQTEPGTAIQVGDVVSAFAPRPGAATAASLPAPGTGTAPASQPYYATSPGAPVDLSNAEQNFKAMVQQRTHINKFDAASHTSLAPSVALVPAFGLYEDYRLVHLGVFGSGPYGGGGVNPWLVGSTVYGAYEGIEMRKRMANMPGAGNSTHRVYLEAIYWDEGLITAYNRYYLAKEAKPVDSNGLEQNRQSLLAQKGINKSLVFQVQVSNRGISAVTLSPFNWHFYLIDSHGNKVKATRYDQALDGSISPSASASGYVYFDRFDANGQPVVSGPVTISAEDILGKKATLTW